MNLLENPFYILGASPRDSRHKIVELSDERSLLVDSHECLKARSELTNPRKRLSAEIAWLPGVGPKQTDQLIALLRSSPRDVLTIEKLPPVARANVLVSGFTQLRVQNVSEIVKWILEISLSFEQFDSENLRSAINEERIVSGFPQIVDNAAVEEEIQERRRFFVSVIQSFLDGIPSKNLVEAVTEAVDIATNNGEKHGPILIDDIVDAYDVGVQEFLNKEEENITALTERLQTAVSADQPDTILSSIVDQLIEVVKNWDSVAQPIQVSMRSRGLTHKASVRVASVVRNLTVRIYNENKKLHLSLKLIEMLEGVFAEVREIAEITAGDKKALDKIAEQSGFDRHLFTITNFCERAIKRSESNRLRAAEEARNIIKSAPQLMSNLIAKKVSSKDIERASDHFAMTLLRCALIYGNATDDWETTAKIIEEASQHARSSEVKLQIKENCRNKHLKKYQQSESFDINDAYTLFIVLLIILATFFIIGR